MKENASFPPASLLAGLTLLGLAAGDSARAAELYWNQSVYRPASTAYLNQWNTSGNWSLDAAGTVPSTAVPTIADNLYFNSTPNNTLGGVVPIESGNAFANSLTFDTLGTTSFSPNNNRTLTLGSGGIAINTGSGNITFGTSSRGFPIDLAASQTWTNNSAGTFAMRLLRVSNTATGPVVLTFNVANSGNFSISTHNQGITDSTDTTKSLALVIDSAGTGEVITGGGSTYTGGTTINRGVLRANAAIGSSAGEVKLGGTAGNAAAKLRIDSASALANNLNVQAGNSGTNTLEFMTTGGAWSGNIALNNVLNVAVVSGGSGAQITGAISGTGNLIKSQYNGGNSGALTLTALNTYSGNTSVLDGTLTLADNAAFTFFIGGNGVNNRLDGTGTLNLNGDFIFDLSAAAAVEGNSWNIVSVGSLLESFGGTFSVQGFNDSDNDNVWTNSGWSFSELTGNLSYTVVPEPSTCTLLIGALLCLISRRRSRLARV